ncbi:MAG TPA: metal ABC transporter permease [Hyphomicrobiaceae bacterium]|nr:metal ABC transporter permease [Hyphomicrobiaceae bacterium]
MAALLDALLLRSGYNAALVAIGAALLGSAAGAVGTFLYLRKRALVADAITHATLPGICLAFMGLTALGLDGRNLSALLAGAAVSAGMGLVAVEWMTRRTRLGEDAAIGAVLSVFFGLGVVLLTVIQAMSQGRQAGLQGFLLGSTAGMLYSEALLIAAGGSAAVVAVVTLRRPMTFVAFDAEHASAIGIDVRAVDFAMMGLVMAITVIGLKVVGLILIVALLIIPPVSARFWSEQSDRIVIAAAALGAAAGYVGAALSVTAPKLPTGALIVLFSAALFVLSLLLAPARGVVATLLRRQRFRKAVHLRQGLLSLAHRERILDGLTLSVLRRRGFIRRDGVATERGLKAAAEALRNERRWDIARELHRTELATSELIGLAPIDTVLTRDEVAAIDRRLALSGSKGVA